MKFKADRATLMKALAHIQSVAEKRNTIPILANALIAVKDGRLSFTATDMEIAVVEEVVASVSRDGATTAPAATLYEIVRKLPESAEIELELAGEQLKLRAGRYSTSLVTLPTDDFPSMTAGALPHRFRLTGLALRGLIDRTRFAISTEVRAPHAARRRDRRPPAGAGRGAAAGRCRRHARRHHPPQDRGRAA